MARSDVVDYTGEMAEVDLLLLDFGGVCLLNPVELHAVAEDALALPRGTLTWMGPVDPSTDEPWVAMTEGRGMSEREYWAFRAAGVGAAAGRSLELRDYMRLLYEPARPELIRPECTRVVAAARAAGVGVAVLTNDMSAFHGPDWATGLAFFDAVDRVFDCSHTGVLKPDPRAYAWVLDDYGIDASRVLFVDDQPGNVAGGAAVGLATHWFDIASAAASWSEVADRIGVSVP